MSQSMFRAFPRPPSPLLRSLFASQSCAEVIPCLNDETFSEGLVQSLRSTDRSSLEALDRFFGNTSGLPSLDSQSTTANFRENAESPIPSTLHETLRYSSASGSVYPFLNVPDVPATAELPGAWLENLMEIEDWTPRQSMESATITPHTVASYNEGGSNHSHYSGTETLTESRENHSYRLRPAVFSPQVPLPPRHPPPMPAAPGWKFRHPDPNTYYSAARVSSRQTILANIAHSTTPPVMILNPPAEEWGEFVLLEAVRDGQGILLYEIISVPGYLLRPNRSLLCHGALSDEWVIVQALQLLEGYVYMRCFRQASEEYAFIRVPQYFYHIDESEWPQLHSSFHESSIQLAY
ncbi:hypothetical protein FB451DRAFT_1171881 [Mycena latifolia]|nr:hypothetical protein FB451DRAFT_1171881 [Mycena latifolia]